MKTTIKKLLAAATLVLAAPLASATVLNFDDLTGMNTLSTYGGLTFNGWSHFDLDQTSLTASSVKTRIFSRSDESSFGSATAFTFQGASLAGYDDVMVQFHMFRNGVQVASSIALNTSDTPFYLDSGYAGLLDLVIVTGDPGNFVLDDLVVNAPVHVPEPGSIALLFAAMGVMGAMGRRRTA